MRIIQTSNKKILFVGLAILAAGLAVFAYLEFSGKTSVFLNRDSDFIEETAITTSDAPSAQNTFSEGGERQISERPEYNEGIISDTGGSVGSIPPENQWIRSANISLYTPIVNQTMASGAVISGQADIPVVHFRLNDSISGRIAQGSLSVVDGRFSGVLEFSTSATEGRLDIFGAREDGVEFSNIEVPVRFR